jgi:hypothetical protein
MKTKLTIILSVLATIILGVSFFSNSNSNSEITVVKKNKKKATQYLVLLDLSDRIAESGQIETDKIIIKNLFQNFKTIIFNHLVMNSNDRFQICIAPQKKMGFDKYIETDEMTLDLSKFKASEKLKQLKDFEKKLSIKIDSLYNKANKGKDSKQYEGSNIWQYFNEELVYLTNENLETNLIVLTDGYFDFEKGNAEINNKNGSTTSSFINKLRNKDNWKDIILSEKYRILPINSEFKNLKVCVSEIRSKDENNLNETAILKYVWSSWLINSHVNTENFITVNHGPISNSQTKINKFLN